MDEKLTAALAKAVACLKAAGYRYMVVGGIAVQKWGRARFTYDVDVRVSVPDTDYAKVRRIIRAAFPESGRPELPRNSLIVAAKVDDVIVDFILTVPGYEEIAFDRVVQYDLDGLSVWVCAPEDLIVQKAIAGRAKDWDDIEGVLIEQRGKLDLAYLEDWLEQFAEVLEQPQIVNEYREIQARIAAMQETRS